MTPVSTLRCVRKQSFADGGLLTKLFILWIRFFASCQDFCTMSSHFEDISDDKLLEDVIASENGTENNHSLQVNLICCTKKIFCVLNV